VQTVLFLLALIGGAALIVRLGRTLLRLALETAEATAASELAKLSRRRGDLTTLAERSEGARAARRSRRLDVALALVWLLLLDAPLFTGGARYVYAACSLVWLLPRRKKSGVKIQ
jgi:hypothetical protein